MGNEINSVGPCIKCGTEKEMATPWLCKKCFDEVTYELAVGFGYAISGERFEQDLRGFRIGAREKNIRAFNINKE
jgi:hypothetical protein